MNPTLSALATAVPAFRFSLADAKRCLEEVMPLPPERLAAVRAVFDQALASLDGATRHLFLLMGAAPAATHHR